MAKKPVDLGDLYFESKKSAEDHFREILWRYQLDENLASDDLLDAMTLLAYHPNAKNKIGVGVKAIKVAATEYPSNRCFHVVRDDGTVENFSLGKCINGDHSAFQKFYIACRKAVDHDIRGYKETFFKEHAGKAGLVKCQASGKPVAFDQSHVDHREPFTFSIIVHFFADSQNIDLSSVSYNTEQEYGNRFSDEHLAVQFRDYHKRHAKLRVIESRKNLGKAYLGRIKATKADGTIQK